MCALCAVVVMQAKFVPVSPQRVLSINTSNSSDLRVNICGDPFETSEFAFADVISGAIDVISCTFTHQAPIMMLSKAAHNCVPKI